MTRPAAGSASSWRTRVNAGDRRSTRPTWLMTPAASTIVARASAWSRSGASGFSQNTALPAATARATASWWAEVQVQTKTASTRSTRASTEGATSAPVSVAKAAARSGSVSYTATISQGVEAPESIIWWNRAMKPVPTKPTRTGVTCSAR